MECIELKKMIFHAYHGVTEQERIVGNNYRIDLKLFLDLSEAIQTDKLEHTLNYADVFNSVKDEMAISSQLIEHVAGRIVQRLKEEYPTILKVNIRLAKLNPPITGEIQEAAIIINT
jgi:dihydroneopterin aldolase